MSISFDFTGRTVIVTGAAQGIGLGIARLFAAAGARVAPFDLDPSTLRSVWGERTDTVAPLAVDVADADAVTVISTATNTVVGSPIDVGASPYGLAVVWKLSTEQWQQVLNVHLGGTFHVTRAAIPHMRGGGFGRIINVTSYTGLHGNVGQANYAAAKAGIIGFTKSLAREVGSRGITANVVAPGFIDTDMTRALAEAQREALTTQIPLGRLGQVSDIAAAVAFLASDDAAYMTGETLHVNGGMYMS